MCGNQRTKHAHQCSRQHDALAGQPASFLSGCADNPAALQPLAADVVAAAAGPNAADHTVAAAAAAAAHTLAAAASGVLEKSQQAVVAGERKAAFAHPGSALETAKPKKRTAKPKYSAAAAAAPAGQLQPALATKQNPVGWASVGSGTALAADLQTAPEPRCWGS